MNLKLSAAAPFVTVAGLAISISAHAADLGARYANEPTTYWTGFYVGANIGGALSRENALTPLGSFSPDPSGVLGGAQFGYNFLLVPNWLLGIEGELDWTSAQGNVIIANSVATATVTSNHNWYDTLDARLGFVQGPWMYYVKGGAAWMNADYLATGNNANGVNAGASVSNTRTGWTIGAGVEYTFAPGWSAKFEYDYLDFGSENLVFGNISSSIDFATQVHEIKLGVNFRWLPGTLFGLF